MNVVAVGEQLKKTRESKKISLQEIADKTNIKKDYLSAIESGEIGKLPTYIHAKGFVRSYANFLGLNGVEFSQKISPDAHLEKEKKTLVQINKIKPKVSWKDVRQEILEQLLRYKKEIVILSLLAVSMFLLFKVGKFVVGSMINSNRDTAVTQTVFADKDVLDNFQTEKKVPLLNLQIQKQSIAYPITVDKLKLYATTSSKVWVAVKADGELVYEGILPADSDEMWVAKNKLNLKIGNAGGINLSLNNKQLGKLGEEGEVIRDLIVTRNGIEIK